MNLFDIPPRNLCSPRSFTEFYGALKVASDYSETGYARAARGTSWQHGWVPQMHQSSPWTVTCGEEPSQKKLYLVARHDEVSYLRKCGYQAIAVGLPFVYALKVAKPAVERVSGSLLIMPAHSSRLQHIAPSAALQEFLAATAAEAPNFNFVYVSLHDEDLRVETANGVWSKWFPVVSGAHVDDLNSLYRMRYLFERFETVWTDREGSHVPMALAAGAKVAVFASKSSHDWMFLKRIEYNAVVQVNHITERRSWLARELPELYCRPSDAVANIRWGQEQIGTPSAVPPRHLVAILRPRSRLNKFARWRG